MIRIFLYFSALIAILSFNLAYSYPNPTRSYGYNKELIPGAYNFYWNITDSNITIELHVKNGGWFGFGFSPNGGMAGADVVILYPSNDTNKPITKDSHIVAYSLEGIIPDQQQDWYLLGHEDVDGFYRSRFTRRLQTCDPNDKNDIDIKNGQMKVIFALGKFNGGILNYHEQTKGVKNIQLIGLQKDVQFKPNDNIETQSLEMNV
jgi:hypothetical protein